MKVALFEKTANISYLQVDIEYLGQYPSVHPPCGLYYLIC